MESDRHHLHPCDVIPDIEEDIDIEINDDDIRVDTYRSVVPADAYQ